MVDKDHQQAIIMVETEIPWYFTEDFQWWWSGVFVPIVIAIIVNRAIKKRKNGNI